MAPFWFPLVGHRAERRLGPAFPPVRATQKNRYEGSRSTTILFSRPDMSPLRLDPNFRINSTVSGSAILKKTACIFPEPIYHIAKKTMGVSPKVSPALSCLPNIFTCVSGYSCLFSRRISSFSMNLRSLYPVQQLRIASTSIHIADGRSVVQYTVGNLSAGIL